MCNMNDVLTDILLLVFETKKKIVETALCINGIPLNIKSFAHNPWND